MKGFNSIIQILNGMARRIKDEFDRRRAILELVRMQDWRLAELGIERGRIPEVVDGLIAKRTKTTATSRAGLPPAPTASAFPGGPVSQVPA